VLDKNLIENIAGALGTRPGLIEKDWHVVRALGVLATLEHQDIRPMFSGGTSLAKGWGLIKRFSEDRQRKWLPEQKRDITAGG
jgi:predicted nucleotidyltransferase component of viral defense system